MMKEAKKILVTGGSGFIGGHMVNKMRNNGYDVTVFDVTKPSADIKYSQFIKGDITDRNVVFDAVQTHDIVIHFAGLLGTHELVDDKKAYQAAQINILGNINILDAALINKTPIYQATKPNYWNNTYTITKIASENFAKMYHKEYGLPVTLLRYYNVYGPRQKTDIYQKAVPTFIIKALKNEELPIFGNGLQTTDHIYVEDAVDACYAMIQLNSSQKNLFWGESVDIGSGIEINVVEIAEKIIKLTNSQSKINYQTMRSGEEDFTNIKANIKQMNMMQFKPKFDFEAGLKQTIDYYKKGGR